MTDSTSHAESNPLLQPATLPRFDAIRPEHVVPAIRHLLGELETELQQVEADLQPTWDHLVAPLERIEDRLTSVWGVVGHLMGVKNSEALRQAQQEVQGEVVQFSMRMGQSQRIYQGLKTLRTSPEWTAL